MGPHEAARSNPCHAQAMPTPASMACQRPCFCMAIALACSGQQPSQAGHLQHAWCDMLSLPGQLRIRVWPRQVDSGPVLSDTCAPQSAHTSHPDSLLRTEMLQHLSRNGLVQQRVENGFLQSHLSLPNLCSELHAVIKISPTEANLALSFSQ